MQIIVCFKKNEKTKNTNISGAVDVVLPASPWLPASLLPPPCLLPASSLQALPPPVHPPCLFSYLLLPTYLPASCPTTPSPTPPPERPRPYPARWAEGWTNAAGAAEGRDAAAGAHVGAEHGLARRRAVVRRETCSIIT